MVQHRQVKHAGVFQGSSHQLRALDAVAIVRDRHHPGLPQRSDRRQRLPFLPKGNRAGGKDVGHAGLFCALTHPGNRVGAVRHRRGVRHRDHRGETSRHRRRRPGRNRLLGRLARLPQMHMGVDQARRHHQAVHFHHQRVLGWLSGENLASLEKQIRPDVPFCRRVQNPAALKKDFAHDSPNPRPPETR